LPYSTDDDSGRFLIDPASAAALHPLRRRGPASGRPALQLPLPRRRPDHPGARLCDLVDLDSLTAEVPAVVDQIMPPTQASLAASTATVRCDCRWHGRTNALVEPSELPADVPSVAWSVRSNSGRRPSDYETDARRRPRRHQTDLACSGWVARRSRRIQKDRLDDQTDDQGHPKDNRMPRRATLLSTTELRRSSTGSSTLQTASIT
jgi:hypothetical protein